MNAVTTTDISASALHSRLSSLRANRLSYHTPQDHENHPESRLGIPPGDYFGPSSGSTTSNTPASPVLSRRPSDEADHHGHDHDHHDHEHDHDHDHEHDHDHIPSGMATPFQPHSRELERLSRVPSYDTAMRSNIRMGNAGLPDYHSAVGSENHTPTPPQSPQRAHVREGNRGSDQNLPTLDLPRRPSPVRSTGHDENHQVF